MNMKNAMNEMIDEMIGGMPWFMKVVWILSILWLLLMFSIGVMAALWLFKNVM